MRFEKNVVDYRHKSKVFAVKKSAIDCYVKALKRFVELMLNV
jgi:hypothetical protein